MIQAKYEIVDCCGDHLCYVWCDVEEGDPDSWDNREMAIREAGYRNYRCESCYDDAYRARLLYTGDHNIVTANTSSSNFVPH